MKKEHTLELLHKEDTILPYEENKESFGEWVRVTAKEKWKKYLSGDLKGLAAKDGDALRGFLIEYGTKEEIEVKLHSFRTNMLAQEALLEEIRSKRPDIKLDDY